MYQFQLARQPVSSTAQGALPLTIPAVVYGIGMSSLLADVSSEMVSSALPVFLFGFLELSPSQVGLLDGIYQATAAIVRLASAGLATSLSRARRIAGLGYALSILARLF